MAHVRTSLNQDHNQDKSTVINMKQFISFAREFVATHSEKSLCSMNKNLGLIALSENASFHPGRLEVSAFFSHLSDVMVHQSGPHWQGIAVLTRAVKDIIARQALVQRYRFLPVLSPLLSDGLTYEKKISLLSLMEELTYQIKINWQEPYLIGLLKKLSHWVLFYNEEDIQQKRICSLSLTVLCNLCYQNIQVTYALMRTVDTRELIKKILNLKDDESGAVQVCRLLLILQAVQSAPACQDIHNFLTVTLQSFFQGIKNCDVTQMRHGSSFLNDLCSDSQTKSYVNTYDKYEGPINEALKYIPSLLSKCSGDNCDTDENVCLENALKFFLILSKTEHYSVRHFYGSLCELCLKSTHILSCLGSVYSLLASIISQFHEDGMLPSDVMEVLSSKASILLKPDGIDPVTCGKQWLEMILSLYECSATQEGVVLHMAKEQFEDIFYQIIQNAVHTASMESAVTKESVLIGCYLCLDLAQTNSPWDAALNRMLANTHVQKVLTGCLCASASERKRALDIVKHPRFPAEKLSQVFCAESAIEPNTFGDVGESKAKYLSLDLPLSNGNSPSLSVLTPSREILLDQTIEKFSQALDNNDIEDITTSNIMELYRYKICCLEQRLNASTESLQAATHNVSSLNHTIALLEATNKSQLELAYRTQCHNEKLKENISRLSDQLSDAEQSIKKFQGKLAAERLDKDQQIANAKHKHTLKLKELEAEMDMKTSIMNDLTSKLKDMDQNNRNLESKLTEQINKNSELAEVLIKFEERVKQRDKKIEEANSQNASTKNDLVQAQQTIKSLQKTLLEREKRLTQLTSQLEEMQRIQEIIANLMGNKSTASSSNNSLG